MTVISLEVYTKGPRITMRKMVFFKMVCYIRIRHCTKCSAK
uniref:Uncharacterized protein n=1 Tax=Anguilla anguilla TaxID=7936 RepID=A0A0E9QC39_ANGAN